MLSIPIDISQYKPAKRRKIAGLNTRFDRMIKSVNSMLSYDSPAVSRKRKQSSGTSSVSSHDIPKTPVDAYSSLHPGKLGKDFSVLKMKQSSLLPQEDSDGFPMPAAPPKVPRNRLPDWLANTFYSLEADHPLRGLLPPSRINTESKSNFLAQLSGVSHGEELFAFSPFDFDKQGGVSDAAYRTDSTLDVQRNDSSIVTTKSTLSHLPEALTDALPFSTPGRFAPVHKSIDNPVVNGTLQRPLIPVLQQVTPDATNMMHPSALSAAHLRLDNEIELPQFTREISYIAQGNGPPSDTQEHGVYMSHNHQVFRGDHDNFNVYATPGPTFSCSLPVYFDSPTEDPSLSDPLEPESYELDLNAIDFRWRPFLRSNVRESDINRHAISPQFPVVYSVPNQVGDQNGWRARFAVDQGVYRASSEELPSLTEDTDIAYLDGVGPILPSNVNGNIINKLIQPWSPSINDVLRQVGLAFAIPPGVFLSPRWNQPELALLAADNVSPRGDGENIHASKEELPLSHGEEVRPVESEAHEIWLSTPIRQVHVSPPSAPKKIRPSQLRGVPATPVRKTSSALSWMIPLKHSKRTNAVHDAADRRFSRPSPKSRDSIESWSETS